MSRLILKKCKLLLCGNRCPASANPILSYKQSIIHNKLIFRRPSEPLAFLQGLNVSLFDSTKFFQFIYFCLITVGQPDAI